MIPVGYVEVTRLWVHRDMGAAVKGMSTVRLSWLPRHADGHQHLAVQRALAHRVALVVGAVERVVVPKGQAVGPGEDSLPPGIERFPLAVEDDHGVIAPVEHIDAILGVYGDCGDVGP